MGSSFLPSVMANQWKPFVGTGLVRVVRIALVRWTWIRGSNPGGMGARKGLWQESKRGMTVLGLGQQQCGNIGKGRLETCLVKMVRF